MIYKTLLLLFLSLSLSASQSSWSVKTPALSDSQTATIVAAYEDNKTTNITFEDDPVAEFTPLYEDNILVLGASLGFGITQERVYNIKGEYTLDFTNANTKLMIGKDFTLWHADYTQPSRFFISYTYTYLSSKVGYHSYLFGYEERMRFWPLYQTDTSILYPTLSCAFGRSDLSRETYKISGRTSEFSTGLTYERQQFEYFFTFSYGQIVWEHPVEGIGDESSNYNLNVGLTYRFMYGAH